MKNKVYAIFMIGLFLISGCFTIFTSGTINKTKNIVIDNVALNTNEEHSVITNSVEFIIEPDSWNFGALYIGESVSKEFVIKNVGTEGDNCNVFLNTIWDDFWISGGGEMYIHPGDEESVTIYFSPKQNPGLTVFCYLYVEWYYDGIKYIAKAKIGGTSKTKEKCILDIHYLPNFKYLFYSDNFLKYISLLRL